MNRFDPRTEPWFDRAGYPFADHFVDVDGGRMHVVDEGPRDGQLPPVVIVHGTPGWTYEWAPLIRALAGSRRVVAVDHIGFGLSDRPTDWRYDLAGHRANLRAVLDRLGVERADLVVHDFGGPIGLPLVLDGPSRFERVVLVNTWLWSFGSTDPGFARQRPILASAAMRWAYRRLNLSAKVIVKAAWGRHRKLTPAHHRHYHGMFPSAAHREGTVGFLREVAGGGADLDDWARRLGPLRDKARQGDVLLVWGGADGFVKSQHRDRWLHELPGLVPFDVAAAGHFPHDEAADVVVPRVAAFLGDGQRRRPATTAGSS